MQEKKGEELADFPIGNLDEHRQMEKDTGRLSGDTLSSDVANVRLCIRDAKEQFCGKETDNEQ